MNKKTALIIPVVLILIAVLVLEAPKVKESVTPKPTQPAKKVTEEDYKPVSFTGIVRTTGLTTEEKADRGIAEVYGNYQLITSDNSYYFIGQDSIFGDLIGKCAQVDVPKASIVPITEADKKANRAYDYSKIYINNSSEVKVSDYSACKIQPYSDPLYPRDMRTFEGVIWRNVRPSADIGYDYVMKVKGGYKDPSNSMGVPDHIFYDVVIYPANGEMLKLIEQNIGKNVTAKGYYIWGWAESKYLLTTELE